MIDVISENADLRESIKLFYFAYRAFTGRADRVLAERGLGRVHHRILYFVGRNPGLSVNALIETLGVTKQALNAPLRQLTERGLIEVQAAAHDRRRKELRLTTEGAQLEADLTGAQMELLRGAFAKAGAEAAGLWREVMRNLPKQVQTRLGSDSQ